MDRYEIAMDIISKRIDKCNSEYETQRERLRKGFKGSMSCANTLRRMKRSKCELDALSALVSEITEKVESEES